MQQQLELKRGGGSDEVIARGFEGDEFLRGH
jgi:hypothetical protein